MRKGLLNLKTINYGMSMAFLCDNLLVCACGCRTRSRDPWALEPRNFLVQILPETERGISGKSSVRSWNSPQKLRVQMEPAKRECVAVWREEWNAALKGCLWKTPWSNLGVGDILIRGPQLRLTSHLKVASGM
jgi:hypothetical protein